MRGIPFTLLVTLIVALSTAATLGQQPNSPPSMGIERPDWYRDMVSSVSERPTHRSEPRVLKKGPLAPSDEDRTTYANLLAQPQTGLIRLLPRQFNMPKNADGMVKINGGGAYYSFALLTHEYGFGSDLELSTTRRFLGRARLPVWHEFSVGFAGADYGMMTNVGHVKLEDLTVADPITHFVLAYDPPRAEPAARCEALVFRQGFIVDNQLYQRNLPIEVNNTYLLRSINYGVSDVAVAFRVVRQENDGSVTLAWKLLKQYSPKRLENVSNVNSTYKCPIK